MPVLTPQMFYRESFARYASKLMESGQSDSSVVQRLDGLDQLLMNRVESVSEEDQVTDHFFPFKLPPLMPA